MAGSKVNVAVKGDQDNDDRTQAQRMEHRGRDNQHAA